MIEHPIWLFIYKSFVKSSRNFTNSFMKHPPGHIFKYILFADNNDWEKLINLKWP